MGDFYCAVIAVKLSEFYFENNFQLLLRLNDEINSDFTPAQSTFMINFGSEELME